MSADGITVRPDGLVVVENVMGLWRLIRTTAYPAHLSGITPQQFWLLRHLEGQCPRSVGALADTLGITASSTTSACKRLEQAGLVTRARQADDERVVEVDLTPRGHAQLEEMRQRQRDVVERLIAVLDPQEQATLDQLLARILNAAREQLDDQPACHSRHAGQHRMEARQGGKHAAPPPHGQNGEDSTPDRVGGTGV